VMNIYNPQNYQEFCISVKYLLEDEDFPSENISTRDFLEAMLAWLNDTSGGSSFFDNTNSDNTHISWSNLLTLLRASAIYE